MLSGLHNRMTRPGRAANTPGPATSVFTSVCAFPQNEQR